MRRIYFEDHAKGFRLSLNQAPNNLHMVFSFDFLDPDWLNEHESGTPGKFFPMKKVSFAEDESLALYIDSSALMKVLGTTVDYDASKSSLVILDSDGTEVITRVITLHPVYSPIGGVLKDWGIYMCAIVVNELLLLK